MVRVQWLGLVVSRPKHGERAGGASAVRESAGWAARLAMVVQ